MQTFFTNSWNQERSGEQQKQKGIPHVINNHDNVWELHMLHG